MFYRRTGLGHISAQEIVEGIIMVRNIVNIIVIVSVDRLMHYSSQLPVDAAPTAESR